MYVNIIQDSIVPINCMDEQATAPEEFGKPSVTLIIGGAIVVVATCPTEFVTTNVTTVGDGVIAGSAETLVRKVR